MSEPHRPDNSDHDTPQKQPSAAMTYALFALLVVWVISIATGTVIYGTTLDWRKPLLVIFPMSLFLALWAGLLLKSHSRQSK